MISHSGNLPACRSFLTDLIIRPVWRINPLFAIPATIAPTALLDTPSGGLPTIPLSWSIVILDRGGQFLRASIKASRYRRDGFLLRVAAIPFSFNCSPVTGGPEKISVYSGP